MSDTAVNDRAVEAHDTLRDLLNTGIREQSLTETIVDTLVDEGAVHWQEDPHVYVTGLRPTPGTITPDELDRIIAVAITETARRIAEDIRDQRDDLGQIGGAADAARHAYTDAATIADATAKLHGAETGR